MDSAQGSVQVAYPKGTSGNPKGRPQGAVNKLTRAVNNLAAKEGPGIVKAVIEAAKLGDPQCRILFFRYCLPRVRFVDTPVERPPLATIDEAAARIAEVATRLERGEIGVEEGAALVEVHKAFVESRRTAQLEVEVGELRDTVARLTQLIEGQGS
jgi:hypothetical protein